MKRAMILTGLAESFGFAFAMRLLTGLGNGAAYVPAMALGSAWFAANKRGFATGIVCVGCDSDYRSTCAWFLVD